MVSLSRDFTLLRKESADRAAADVVESFDPQGKRKERAAARHEQIVAPLVEAATSGVELSLAYMASTYRGDRKDGDMIGVLAGNTVHVFHWKANNGFGGAELRLYPPMPKRDFSESKLRHGVNALYGTKDDVPSITLVTYGQRVDTHVDDKHIESLDGPYAQQLLTVAQAVVSRASVNQQRIDAMRPREVEPGVSEVSRRRDKSLVEVLTNAKPRPDPKSAPPLGTDLCGAASWAGNPIVVTSDADGKSPVHVMIEREVEGKRVWWPIAVPDDPTFPRRGTSLVVSGNRLELVGGLDAEDGAIAARWSFDLLGASTKGFTDVQWTKKGLPNGVAWAAVAEDDKDSFVAGGVAGFWLNRRSTSDGGSSDVKQANVRNAFSVGGFPEYLERSPPPSTLVGSSAVAARGYLLVGPGTSCDGALCIYSKKDREWFRLPLLPVRSGLGQVHFELGDQGRYVLYTGGFWPGKDGSGIGNAQNDIWRLDLDGAGKWEKVGQNDAVAGNARVVSRDNRMVSLMVAGDNALMVHLE